MNFYNDIEPFCVEVLRENIHRGRLPQGYVDDRSIKDIQPADLVGYDQCHFFAGIGGFPLGLMRAGYTGPIWTGGFPCQDVSTAGRGAGIEKGTRSGLWRELFRLIRNCRPPLVLLENVPALRTRGYDRIADALERISYAVWTPVVGAWAVGSKQRRNRAWIFAYSMRHQQPRKEPRFREAGRVGREEQSIPWDEPWESALCRFRRMDDGLSYGVDRTDSIRNALLPQIVEAYGRWFQLMRFDSPITPTHPSEGASDE